MTTSPAEPGTGQGMTFILADGVEVRVDARTQLRINGPRHLDLQSGQIYIDTNGRSAGVDHEPIEIVAGGSLIRDVGTRFLVRSSSAVDVFVREGRVQLERGPVRHEVGAGERLEIAAGGRVSVTTAPIFGAMWDWIVRAAPPQEVEGRTLAEFLAWVEREGGRAIRFADAAVGREAARTRVYGAIDGLSVDEALAAVLPSCGLAHRVDGAVITIVASDDARTLR